jgi:2,3-bisphosphoglycerate-dependent phosphoglycerate mutase
MPDQPVAYRQIQFQAPPGAAQLILVRHGESEAAIEGKPFELVEGHSDPALSPEGVEQAELVCARLASEPIDAIYVSNLRRTAQTAAPLVARLGLTPIVERDLREVFLGEWETGLFRKKVIERDPIAVRMAELQRWDVIPGAEPQEEFARRARSVVERIAAAHPDQCVAVFAHGAIIGEMLSQACGATGFAFTSDNTGISQLVVTPPRWIVRRFNDTAHLDVPLTTPR